MNAPATAPTWKVILILVARLIFAGVLADMNGTAGYIAGAGFPLPLLLAWLAAFFEVALVLCLLMGAYVIGAALLAALYVLFLAFALHGPAHWKPDDPTEFGFFVDHFTFIAGLLFAAVHGPGSVLALRRSFIART